jgi:hypothetical protein
MPRTTYSQCDLPGKEELIKMALASKKATKAQAKKMTKDELCDLLKIDTTQVKQGVGIDEARKQRKRIVEAKVQGVSLDELDPLAQAVGEVIATASEEEKEQESVEEIVMKNPEVQSCVSNLKNKGARMTWPKHCSAYTSSSAFAGLENVDFKLAKKEGKIFSLKMCWDETLQIKVAKMKKQKKKPLSDGCSVMKFFESKGSCKKHIIDILKNHLGSKVTKPQLESTNIDICEEIIKLICIEGFNYGEIDLFLQLCATLMETHATGGKQVKSTLTKAIFEQALGTILNYVQLAKKESQTSINEAINRTKQMIEQVNDLRKGKLFCAPCGPSSSSSLSKPLYTAM